MVIGDYIHLRYVNYQKYGTAKWGEPKQDLSVSLAQQKAKNLQRINNLQNRNISKATLNELKMRVADESSQKLAREYAEEGQAMSQGLNMLSERALDYLTRNIGKDIGKISLLTRRNLKADESKVNINNAVRMRSRIYENINRINTNIEQNKPVQPQSLDTLKRNFTEFFEALGISVNIEQDFASLFKIKADGNTLGQLKKVVSAISLSDANRATINGVFGEALVNMADDGIKVLAGKELYQAIDSSLKTGFVSSTFQMDETMIKPSVADEYKMQTGINLYQAHKTQNKVDASIMINGQEVNASVKAYTPKGNFLKPHLQDINLINALAATEGQFANHWINLHLANYPFSTQEIDEVFQDTLAYEALAAGNMLKKDAQIADTFVAIDAVNGVVYTATTADILNNNISNFTFHPSLGSIRFTNEKASTWDARIAGILREIHQNKVAVMYSINLKSL